MQWARLGWCWMQSMLTIRWQRTTKQRCLKRRGQRDLSLDRRQERSRVVMPMTATPPMLWGGHSRLPSLTTPMMLLANQSRHWTSPTHPTVLVVLRALHVLLHP